MSDLSDTGIQKAIERVANNLQQSVSVLCSTSQYAVPNPQTAADGLFAVANAMNRIADEIANIRLTTIATSSPQRRSFFGLRRDGYDSMP